MALSIDFAPMEGITGFAFRNAHHKFYGGISRYYTPFLNVQAESGFSRSDARDISFENNKTLLEDPNCALVPQILSGISDTLITGIRILAGMGYSEVNWNLGCPSPTVTRKGRGAGLLAEPEKIDRILDETFTTLKKEDCSFRLSVKMRPGFDSADRLPELISILNRYPLSEIILHPRVAVQGYQGSVDEDAFAEALSISTHPLTWNGDITRAEDAEHVCRRFPQVKRIMIGRGLVTNPALAEEIVKHFQRGDGKEYVEICRQNKQPEKPEAKRDSEVARFHAFHDEILQGYESYIPDEKGILARMKELWGWWEKAPVFTHSWPSREDLPRAFKKIKKAKNMGEYKAAVGQLTDW